MNPAMDGLRVRGIYPLPAKRVSWGQGETCAGASRWRYSIDAVSVETIIPAFLFQAQPPADHGARA
ncbi:MAG TPA: hypothetical protein PLP90_03665, partial [Methanoculleus sp.]|nr:hypothetical protein [Methanoculleus sp.]